MSYAPYPPPPSYPPHPYTGYPPGFPAPPHRPKRRTWLIVLVVVGSIVLVCGGGVGGLAYLGIAMIKQELVNDLRDHPDVQQHIGEITDVDVEWIASGAEKDDDTFVYSITGTKGKGTLTAKSVTNDAGNEDLISATLRLPDGTTVVLKEPAPEQ